MVDMEKAALTCCHCQRARKGAELANARTSTDERERERQIELIIKVRPTVLPSSHVRQTGQPHGMSANIFGIHSFCVSIRLHLL